MEFSFTENEELLYEVNIVYIQNSFKNTISCGSPNARRDNSIAVTFILSIYCFI